MKNLYLNGHTATRPHGHTATRQNGRATKFLFKFFLILFYVGILSTNGIAQTSSDSKFVVGSEYFDEHHLWFRDHKLYVQVVNNATSTEVYTIEIITSEFEIVDYSDNPFTKVYNGMVGDDEEYKYTKDVSILSGEVYTSIFYTYKINSFKKTPSLPVRVKDDNGVYIDRNIKYETTDPLTTWWVNYQDLDYLRYTSKVNLFVNDTSTPVFLQDCNNEKYLAEPIPLPPPFEAASGLPIIKEPYTSYPAYIDWLIIGEVFMDVTGSYENEWDAVNDDTYHLTGNDFSIGDLNNGKRNFITLLSEESQLIISGETVFNANSTRVVSGGLYDFFNGERFLKMGGGILVMPDAKLILNNSLIQDQVNGITLEAGATLEMENTFLTDNLVGIRVKAGTPNLVTKIKLNKCAFSGSGQLKTNPENKKFPFAHIQVEPGAKVEIEFMDPSGTPANSTSFLQADYAIYSEGSEVFINGGTIDYSLDFTSSYSLGGFFGNLVNEVIDDSYYISPFDGTPVHLVSPIIKGVGVYHKECDAGLELLEITSNANTKLDIKGARVGILVEDANLDATDFNVKDSEESGIEITECDDRNIAISEGRITSAPVAMKIHQNSNSDITLEDNYSSTTVGLDISFNQNSEIYSTLAEIHAGEGVHLISNNGSRIHFNDNYAETLRAGIKILNNRASEIKIDENEIYCFKDNITSIMNRMSTVLIEDNILWARKTEESNADNTHGIYISERSLANPFEEVIYDPFSLPLGTYRIKGNDIRMRGAQYGINAVNCRLVNISENEISMATLNTSEYIENSYGIFVQGGEYNYFSCNSMLSIDQYSRDNTAMYLANTLNTNVSNNYTSWLKTGLKIMGNNLDADIRTNVFYKHVNGLEYGEPTTMALTGKQLYKGNQWLDNAGGSSLYDAILHEDFLASQNQYDVNETHEPLCMPGIIQPSSGWFRDLSEMNNLLLYPDCLVEEEPIMTPEEEFYHENFFIIAYDSIDLGPYEEEIRQDHYRYLYRGLNLVDRPYPLSTSQVETGLIARGLNTDLADAHIAMESFVFGDSTGLDVTGLASTINGVTLPSGATDQEIALLKTMQALRYQLIGDTTNYNTLFSALTLTAAACPLEYGEAVYWARMILGPDHEVDYTDYSDCNRAPLLKQEDPHTIRGFHAYPVPSSGQIMVDLPSESEKLHVLDVRGQIIQSLQITEMEKVELNIKGHGMYFISVKDKKGEVYTQKVIILN